jgi:hypothetical protein
LASFRVLTKKLFSMLSVQTTWLDSRASSATSAAASRKSPRQKFEVLVDFAVVRVCARVGGGGVSTNQ